MRTDGDGFHLIDTLKTFIRHDSLKDRLQAGLAIICDDEFAYFARYAWR